PSTLVEPTVTAPSSEWWFPSEGGEILEIPTLQIGSCSPAADGSHIIALEGFSIAPAEDTTAPGTGNVGDDSNGPGSTCASCATSSAPNQGNPYAPPDFVSRSGAPGSAGPSASGP